MTAKVLCACGSGVATSQTVASKVDRLLKERGIAADVEAISFGQVDRRIKEADAYISIIRYDKEFPCPVLNGVAFLTGVGQDAELEKLIEAIKDK